MQGRNATEFMRDIKLMREPTPAGGDRDGGGKNRPPNAEEQAAAADEALRVTYSGWLQTMIDDRDQFILARISTVNDLEELRMALGRKIAAIKKERAA
jgi:hypothetical protein